MREELANIVRQRYGDKEVSTATLIVPTQEQLEHYSRHQGQTSLWIALEKNPHLVIIDTADFIHLRHAWVGTRQREALRLVISSGIQSVAVDRPRVNTYGQRVEGLELSIHYEHWHRRDIPYTEELKPLW